MLYNKNKKLNSSAQISQLSATRNTTVSYLKYFLLRIKGHYYRYKKHHLAIFKICPGINAIHRDMLLGNIIYG